jgi:hypothetical protein
LSLPIFLSFLEEAVAPPFALASTFSPLIMGGDIQMFRMVCRRDLVLSKLLMIAAKKACRTLDIAAMNGCMTSSVDTYRRYVVGGHTTRPDLQIAKTRMAVVSIVVFFNGRSKCVMFSACYISMVARRKWLAGCLLVFD